LTEQGVGALLQHGRTCPQDPEDDMILIILILNFCITNLFNSVLQKVSTGVNPHYLDLWQHAHQSNAEAAERLVSISFYSYAIFVTFVLNSIFCRTDIWRS
jgi:hypothetical protein